MRHVMVGLNKNPLQKFVSFLEPQKYDGYN